MTFKVRRLHCCVIGSSREVTVGFFILWAVSLQLRWRRFHSGTGGVPPAHPEKTEALSSSPGSTVTRLMEAGGVFFSQSQTVGFFILNNRPVLGQSAHWIINRNRGCRRCGRTELAAKRGKWHQAFPRSYCSRHDGKVITHVVSKSTLKTKEKDKQIRMEKCCSGHHPRKQKATVRRGKSTGLKRIRF